MKKKEFIEKIKPLSIKAYQEFGILPSLTIAQAICESAWGKKAPGNMLFGIKWTYGCGYDWQELWTSEFVNGKYIRVKAKFRKYDSWNESIEDHSKLLMLKRYTPVRECKDYICATEQIRKCGYATSPTYTRTLRKIIEQNKLQEIDEDAQILSPEVVKEIKQSRKDYAEGKYTTFEEFFTEVDIEQFVNLLKETKEIVEKLLEKIEAFLNEREN